MPLELEFFTLTGPITDLILKHPPSTGLDGSYDVAIDPIGGPAQEINYDYGVTGSSITGIITYNLTGSDIKRVRQTYQLTGETGPILRVLYNYPV
jgi:hypothetical protein